MRPAPEVTPRMEGRRSIAAVMFLVRRMSAMVSFGGCFRQAFNWSQPLYAGRSASVYPLLTITNQISAHSKR